jgi:hypothetical protein
MTTLKTPWGRVSVSSWKDGKQREKVQILISMVANNWLK